MPPIFELRPQQEDDAVFIQALINQHKQDSLIQAGLPISLVEHLLPMQVRAHLAGIVGDRQDIIMLNGVPVGRIVMQRRTNALHLVELLLSVDQRGKGLGSALISYLQVYARKERINISLNVEVINPARALYNRMGFKERPIQGVSVPMEWRHDADICKS